MYFAYSFVEFYSISAELTRDPKIVKSSKIYDCITTVDYTPHWKTPLVNGFTQTFLSNLIKTFCSTVDLFLLCAIRVFLWLLPALLHQTGRADRLPGLTQVFLEVIYARVV